MQNMRRQCTEPYIRFCRHYAIKTITYPLVKGVCLENREKWMELCEQASTEQDPEKLLALVQEINRLLEAKQERVNNQKLPKD
jgi:hypothetical protein